MRKRRNEKLRNQEKEKKGAILEIRGTKGIRGRAWAISLISLVPLITLIEIHRFLLLFRAPLSQPWSLGGGCKDLLLRARPHAHPAG